MATLDNLTQATARPGILSLLFARDGALGSSQSRAFTLVQLLETILDGLTVINVTFTDPSALSPSDGDRYIVASGATGAWAGNVGAIATYNGGSWEFSTPAEGWIAYSTAQNRGYRYDGTNWSDAEAGNAISFDNSEGLAATDVQGAIDEIFNTSALQLPAYTLSNLPAATPAGRMAYCTDETGGAVPVFSDGTNWRRVTDRAIAT